MDNINQLEAILLGPRLKKLGEKILAATQSEFRRRGVKVSPRLLPPLFQLNFFGVCGVTELARALSVTHAAASQMVKNLVKLKLAQIKADRLDERRTIVSITSHGRYLIKSSLPALKEMKKINELAVNQISPHFFQILSRIESELAGILASKNNQQRQDQEAGSGI